MKKLNLLLLMGLILVSNLIFAQLHTSTTVVPKRFKVGDMYYASSFKGLSLLMADIKPENPELYAKLEPAFNHIKSKRSKALTSLVTGGLIGSSLIVGGFTFLQKENTVFEPGSTFYEANSKSPNFTAIGIGMGINMLGAIVAVILYPKDSDIYQFINLHNKLNPDRKLDWQIGLNYDNYQKFGFRVSVSF